MAFEIKKGVAKIDGISADRGSSEDASRKLRIDLSIAGVDSSLVAEIIGGYNGKLVSECFFDDGAKPLDRNPRFLGIQSFTSQTFFENAHRITFKGLDPLQVERIGHFKLVPRGGATWDIETKIAIADPPDGVFDTLWEQVHSDIEFILETTELPLQGGATREPKTTGLGKQRKRRGNGASAGTLQ